MGVTRGIDIGTSGTKALAIDERGVILATASSEYPCAHPKPGWSEQDPDLWWAATVATVRGAPLALYGGPRVRDELGRHSAGRRRGGVHRQDELRLGVPRADRMGRRCGKTT